MPQFTAISRDSHAGKKWQRFKNYGFASTSALAPVVGVEIARAALAMPLAFFQEARRFVLVAVLSLTPNRNMLVAPDGRWLGGYVPAFLRSYPFALLPQQGTDQTRAVHRYRQRACGRRQCCRRGFRWPGRQHLAGPEKGSRFLERAGAQPQGYRCGGGSLGRSRGHSALAD